MLKNLNVLKALVIEKKAGKCAYGLKSSLDEESFPDKPVEIFLLKKCRKMVLTSSKASFARLLGYKKCKVFLK